MQKIKIEFSKHRSNGYLLDFLIKSLEIHQREEKLQKIYQRFLQEDEISAQEYFDTENTIIEDILYSFFENSETEEYKYYEGLIKEFLSYYNLYKLNNETLGASQKQLDFMTIINLFIPLLSHLAFDVSLKYRKNLTLINSILPDEKENSIQKLFKLIDSTFEQNRNLKEEVYKILDENYKDYNLAKENYTNWLKGDNMPNQGHVNILSKLSKFSNKFSEEDLKLLFQLAKIIQYLYSKSNEYFGLELTNIIIKHYKTMTMVSYLEVSKKLDVLQKNLPIKRRDQFELYLQKFYSFSFNLFYILKYFARNIDIPNKSSDMTEHIVENRKHFDLLYKIDEEMFFKKIKTVLPINFFDKEDDNMPLFNIDQNDINQDFFKFSTLSSKLYEYVYPNNKKDKNSETNFFNVVEELEKSFDIDQEPYSLFMKARFYAQKREYKKSTKLYLEALKYGKDSIGTALKDIIKEGLFVSAQDTREEQLTLLNKGSFTKFYKEAFFYKLIDDLPKEINSHFLLDMQKQFNIYFKNMFPGIKEISSNIISSNHSLVLTEDLENIKIDFQNPDKWIKKVYLNKTTQLMHCCSQSYMNDVKKLLQVNVDVNIKRLNDNCTALIFSFGSTFYTSEVQVEIMKLLIPKMSSEALNAKLIKKKETAMSYAIEKGFVDIVELMISNNVNLNEKCTLDELSYLYYCIQLIRYSTLSSNEFSNLLDRAEKKVSSSHEESNKTIKSNPLINNIFNNEISLNLEKISPEEKDFQKSIRKTIHEFTYKKNKDNYYKIFNLLLDNLDNVDIPVKNGFTPLIFAAEINDIYIVKELLSKGANIDYHNDFNHRAYDYAEENKNEELMDLLC